METDEAQRKGRKGKFTEAFKEEVLQVLQDNKLSDLRSAKLSQDDFSGCWQSSTKQASILANIC